jgi:hypothetical protein
MQKKIRIENLKSKRNNDEASFGKSIDAVAFSLNHHLERKSVATDKEILTTAIKSSLGEITHDSIRKAFGENKSIIMVKGKP